MIELKHGFCDIRIPIISCCSNGCLGRRQRDPIPQRGRRREPPRVPERDGEDNPGVANFFGVDVQVALVKEIDHAHLAWGHGTAVADFVVVKLKLDTDEVEGIAGGELSKRLDHGWRGTGRSGINRDGH